MSISVVTLGTGTWPLVDQIERQHGSVTVVRRCLDLSELLACAHSGMARARALGDSPPPLELARPDGDAADMCAGVSRA